DLPGETHVEHSVKKFAVASARRPRLQQRGEVAHFFGVRSSRLRSEQLLEVPVLRLFGRSEMGKYQIPDLLRSRALFREADNVALIGAGNDRCRFIRVSLLEFRELEERVQFCR